MPRYAGVSKRRKRLEKRLARSEGVSRSNVSESRVRERLGVRDPWVGTVASGARVKLYYGAFMNPDFRLKLAFKRLKREGGGKKKRKIRTHHRIGRRRR